MAARDDATLLTARWVVGHENGRHCLYENGEVVFRATASSTWATAIPAWRRAATTTAAR